MAITTVDDATLVSRLIEVAHKGTTNVELGDVTIEVRFVQRDEGAYVVLQRADATPVAVQLYRVRVDESKASTRATTQELLDAYLARNGQITKVERNASSGMSAKDMARKAQGLKVATTEEIEAERDRRALIALGNKDMDLVLKIMTGKFNREIKFDIENGRLGPNGEIR